MKILHITLEYPPTPGGGATYVHGLVSAQVRHARKAKVHVLTAGEANQRASQNGIVVIRRASLKRALKSSLLSAAIVDDVLAVIDDVKPDIIHAHHTVPALLCQAISRVHPIRFVITQHRTPEEPGRPVKADGKGLLAELAYSGGSQEYWIAPSHFFRDRLIQSGVNGKNICVVWPSIQFDKTRCFVEDKGILEDSGRKVYGAAAAASTETHAYFLGAVSSRKNETYNGFNVINQVPFQLGLIEVKL